jgi:hypothetical protein
MPRPETVYKCTSCERVVGKKNLLGKRAVFKEVGKGGTTVRTRTVGWLCTIDQEDGTPSCVMQDPDWSLPAYAASPGMEGTAIAKAYQEGTDAP